MADTFQWLKLFLDNWKTILTIVTLLSGWAVDNSLKAEQITATEQVAKIYADVAATQWEEKQVIKETKIIQQDCSICNRLEQRFNEHLRRFH